MHEFVSAIASWNVAVARDGRRLGIVIRSKDTPNAEYERPYYQSCALLMMRIVAILCLARRQGRQPWPGTTAALTTRRWRPPPALAGRRAAVTPGRRIGFSRRSHQQLRRLVCPGGPQWLVPRGVADGGCGSAGTGERPRRGCGRRRLPAARHARSGRARRRAEHLAQLGEMAGDAVYAPGELVDLALEAARCGSTSFLAAARSRSAWALAWASSWPTLLSARKPVGFGTEPPTVGNPS
jgi:hypothetical protein